MSSKTKNITVVLTLITLAFGGYYMYTQSKNSATAEGDLALTQDMLVNTQVFIERRTILDRTQVNTEIFADPVFQSYKSFSKPIIKDTSGRVNPFSRTVGQVIPAEI